MHRFTIFSSLILISLLALLSVIAVAQESSTSGSVLSDTLKPEANSSPDQMDTVSDRPPLPQFFMKEVLVTSSRYEKGSFRVPNSVYVISQEKKEKADPQILADLLKHAPGVEVTEAGPFNTRPVIRGLVGSKILLLVDGERLNDTRESPFSGAQLSLVDIDEVERIEVVNGPGTVLYGSDALGGVVNVITKKATFGPSNTINWGAAYKFRYSTMGDQKKNRLDLKAATSKWALNLGGSFRKVPNDYLTADQFSKDSIVSNSKLKEEFEMGVSLGYKLKENQTLLLDAQRNRDFGIGFAGFSPLSYPFRQRDKVSLAYEGKNLFKRLPSLRVKGYYQELTKLFQFQGSFGPRSEEHTSELQSPTNLVCR